MPAPRQQRARHSPRALTRTNPGRAQDVPLVFEKIAGSTIVFLGAPDSIPLILAGTPAITGTSIPGVVTGMSQGDDRLVVTFDVAPTFPGTLIWPANDPGVRTNWGGFIAPINIEIPDGGQAPVEVPRAPWTVSAPGGPSAIFDFGARTPAFAASGGASFRNVTNDELPNGNTVVGNTIVSTFDSDPEPGHVFEYLNGAADVWINDTGALPAYGPETAT